METTKEIPMGVSMTGGPGKYYHLTAHDPVDKKDVQRDDLTFPGLIAFVAARAELIKSFATETMFEVDVEEMTIKLDVNYHGHYGPDGNIIPRLTLAAKTEKTTDACTIDAIMERSWDGEQLAAALKKIPHLFVGGDDECKKIVLALKNFKISIKKMLASTANDANERTRLLTSEFEEKPSDLKWSWNYAIYVGQEENSLPCELVYELNDAGTGVNIILRDPTKVLTERKMQKQMMQDTVAKLVDLVGPTIPFVHVN